MGYLKYHLPFVSILFLNICLFAANVWSQTCFTPLQNTLRNYGICSPNADVSLCCAVGDSCMSNGLCMNGSYTPPLFYRAGCTSVKYPAHPGVCPDFCPVTTGSSKLNNPTYRL